MKKFLITLLVVLTAVTTAFYFLTARSVRKKSDNVLSRFKDIDSSLNFSTDSIHVLKGVGAVQRVYPISIIKSQIILLIDSLKENYGSIPESSNLNDASKRIRSDIMRLLNDVKHTNKYIQDMANSRIPDTIKYWPGSDKFSENKWFSIYFENTSKEGIITYLDYLRAQTLAIDFSSSY